MAAHTMVTGPITIPRQLGDLISEAVLDLIKESWGPEDYDLYYHDEPVWFVRQSKQVGSMIEVRRVQIAAFDTVEGQEVRAIPDAYRYNPEQKRIELTVSQESRSRGTQSVRLWELMSLLVQNAADQAKWRLRSVIDNAWKNAEELSPDSVPDF